MAVTQSWVESANDPQTDFPLANLPFGVFRRSDGAACAGVAIGDRILDLRAAAGAGLFAGLDDEIARSCEQDSLNAWMGLGSEAVSALRARLMESLSGRSARARVAALLVPQRSTEMLLPARIGDYTDFYASVYHATNVGDCFVPIIRCYLTTNMFRSDITGGYRRSSSAAPDSAPLRPDESRRCSGSFLRSEQVARL